MATLDLCGSPPLFTLAAMGCLPGRGGGLERETGFEPATFCLGSRHSAS